VRSDNSGSIVASSCTGATAYCDDNNDIVLHGGCELTIGGDDTFIQSNYATDPDDDATASGWTCGACAGSLTGGTVELITRVTCIDVP
jgi:hypothetical protein